MRGIWLSAYRYLSDGTSSYVTCLSLPSPQQIVISPLQRAMIVRLSARPTLLDSLTWVSDPNARHFHDRNLSQSKGGSVAYQDCCSLYSNEQKSMGFWASHGWFPKQPAERRRTVLSKATPKRKLTVHFSMMVETVGVGGDWKVTPRSLNFWWTVWSHCFRFKRVCLHLCCEITLAARGHAHS